MNLDVLAVLAFVAGGFWLGFLIGNRYGERRAKYKGVGGSDNSFRRIFGPHL